MRANLKDDSGISTLVKSLETRELPSEVVRSLKKQNLIVSSERKEEVLKRLDEKPLFVLTGQQVGLYGGPLLTLYKAVTAIKAARYLSDKLKRVVIPVFWLQSEDHDLAEISTITISTSSSEVMKISINQESAKENRRSVGSVLFTDKIITSNEELIRNLSASPNSEPILKSIVKYYSPGKSWSDSFLGLYKELFKDTDLLFFDLNRDDLKTTPIVKNVFRKSILEMEKIETSLTMSTKAQNVTSGVSLKYGSPLAFISDSHGNRFRVTLDSNGKFTAANQTSFEFSREALISLVESEPERFSSSALLRPLIQDSIFPTLAYVGGDVELQYHRQLDNIYSEFGLTPPLLISREKFRLLSKKTSQLVAEIGLPLETFLETNEQIGKKLRGTGRQFGIDTQFYLEGIKLEIEKLSSQFEPIVEEIDRTLEEPLRKTTVNAINGYTQFLARLGKASIQKDSVTLNRIEKIRLQVFPFGKEQERELGLVSVLSKTGVRFIEQLNNLPSEFDGSIRELVIEE